MKKLIIAVMLMATTPVFAQLGGGTYCSARTEDGNWGFIFNRNSMGANCDAVFQGLRQVSGTPVVEVKRGYWNVRGYNRVLIDCGFYRNRITSVGAYALQNAYITAQSSRWSHCIFYVNNW